MRRFKILSFLIIAVITAAVALSACVPVRDSDGDYVTYTLSDVVMTQQGVNTYRFEFDVDCGDEAVKVYFVERDRLKSDDVPVNVTKTVNGDNAHITFTLPLSLSEEYFLWVVGSKEAVLPITAPSMFPSMKKDVNDVVTFDFGFSFDASWSSFCDPTGRAVYSSDAAVFDANATAVRTGLKITEQEYIIPETEFDADKYYYSVTTAKNGLLTIISAPVSLSDSVFSQIDGISVNLAEVDGVPTMSVSVTPVADSQLAQSNAEHLQMFVKNDFGDEIYGCDTVWKDGTAVMRFDCSNLITAGKWYDVCFAYRGAMIGDVPCEWNGSDVGTKNGVTGTNGIKYSFADFEGQLKVYYDYPPVSAYDYCNYTVAFDAQNEALTVTVSKIFGDNPIPTLAVTAGSTEKIMEAQYRIVDGKYVYTIGLKGKGEAGVWYDIRLFFGSVCAEVGKDATEQFGTEFTVGSRTYSFQEWDGLLKIMFTEK